MRRRDEGFTLIEMLITVVILGIIMVPLSNVVIGVLRNTDATSARLAESHDVQITSTYWAQDVASIGTRDTANPLSPQLLKSVETSVSNSGGSYPCGTTGTAAVRFISDNIASGATPTNSRTMVAYYPVAVGTRFELHRLRCVGSATPVSDIVVAHDLTASPTVSCNVTCTGTGSDVPTSVTMTMSLLDPKDTGTAYSVTLSGQRRQT